MDSVRTYLPLHKTQVHEYIMVSTRIVRMVIQFNIPVYYTEVLEYISEYKNNSFKKDEFYSVYTCVQDPGTQELP